MSPEQAATRRRPAGPGAIVFDFLRRPEQFPESSRHLLPRSRSHCALYHRLYRHSLINYNTFCLFTFANSMAPRVVTSYQMSLFKKLNYRITVECALLVRWVKEVASLESRTARRGSCVPQRRVVQRTCDYGVNACESR